MQLRSFVLPLLLATPLSAISSLEATETRSLLNKRDKVLDASGQSMEGPLDWLGDLFGGLFGGSPSQEAAPADTGASGAPQEPLFDTVHRSTCDGKKCLWWCHKIQPGCEYHGSYHGKPKGKMGSFEGQWATDKYVSEDQYLKAFDEATDESKFIPQNKEIPMTKAEKEMEKWPLWKRLR